jgi:hypothetical protein
MQNNPHLLNPPHTSPSCTQFTVSIRKFIQQHPPAKSTIKTAYIKAFLNEASLPNRSPLRSLKTNQLFTQISTQISPSLNKTATAPTPITALPKIAFPRRISTEQYHRILAANSLHYSTAHTPDKKLCYELNHGKHQYSDLTSSDIVLMRQVLGPCPHCPNPKLTPFCHTACSAAWRNNLLRSKKASLPSAWWFHSNNYHGG